MRLATIARRQALTVVVVATVALAAVSAVPPAHAVDANYQLIQEPDAGYSPMSV